jgi:Zn-dependent peptidase ImmA (M78 family)
MRWARERAGLNIEEAAAKIGRPKGDVEGWENGTSRPTIPQARRASEVYRRPLAVFYLPEPPKEFTTLRDFRSLPDSQPREYSPGLSLLVRTAMMRQQWLREFLTQDKVRKLPYVGSADLNMKPVEVANEIRSTLGVTPGEQRGCGTRREAVNLWVERAEEEGVFVFRRGRIDPEEARGFLLADDIAPFIYVNSDDALAAQMFTLAHELAHLWLNEGGISNLEPIDPRRRDDTARIELFCNRVAAEAILEGDSFDGEWGSMERGVPMERRIESLSRTFKVSEEVIARRLLDTKQIGREEYMNLRNLYLERWSRNKAREREKLRSSEGGPSFYRIKAFNNGYSFTRTVLSAYESGLISGRDASGLLDVKINRMGKLAARMGMSLPVTSWRP